MDKLKEKLKEESGEVLVSTFILIAVLLALSLFIMDFLRVYTLQENISDDLYRASNLSIKTAMYDSHRIDGVSKYNEDVCRDAFYDYLYSDIGLNGSLELQDSDGGTIYRIDIEDIRLNGDTTRMQVEAKVYTKMMFFPAEWEFPISVKSRNMRTDI